jgi:uncharacterized membrane protein YphA (DoxX/SURF4 family)
VSVDPVFAWVARLSLALLFGTAALHKARDLPVFAATLRDYRILPDALAPIAARCLVAVELGLLAALLTPALDPLGAAGCVVVLGAYSSAIALNLARGRRHIDCGCLGPAQRQALSPWLLTRNGLLALGALLLLLPLATRPVSWLDAASILGGVGMLALLWNAAHQLGSVSPALRAPGRSP